MAKPVYRSLADLKIATYFANPPAADQLVEQAPDGSPMTILACIVPPDLWRWNKDLRCLENTKTGLTKAWAFERNALFAPMPISDHVPEWKREGYASRDDWALELRAQDGTEPQVWRDLTQQKPTAPVERPAKRFSPRDVATRPGEYFTATDLKEVVQRAGQAVMDLCEIARFLPFDQQLRPKLAGRMRELAEREIESCMTYGLRLKDELAALNRGNLETEIDLQAIEQKERQMHYLRSQLYLMQRIEQGVVEAYDTVVDQYEEEHGRKWYAYKGIAERAVKWKRVAVDEKRAETRRLAMADALSPPEFARYIAGLRAYSPSSFTEGVNGQEPGLTKRMVVGRKMKGDFHQPDSVRRVLGSDRSSAGSYGEGDGDWSHFEE